MNFRITLFAFFSLVFYCCSNKSEPKFEVLSSEKTGVTFANTIVETTELNPLNFTYIYNGAGVGAGDINNDGLPDLFFAGNMVSSKLYLNKGNFQFDDITTQAGVTHPGWATGVSMVDINADGLLDIYVCIAGKDSLKENLLYINRGDATFKECAKEYGLNDSGYSTQAAFFDYDRDGDLDAYILTNGLEKFSHNNTRPRKIKGEGVSTDRLYRNNGDHTFTNVSQQAGITIEGYGLGIAILDVNEDGWPDIYCANDFVTNDLLWVNNGDGTFTDGIRNYITQTSHNGMGIDISDFNNDGLVDIVEMDMLPESNMHNKTMTPAMNYQNQAVRFEMGYLPQYVRNTLQLRNNKNMFSEIGRLAGVHKTDWSWAPLFADLDNDGLKDLFITNGYGRDITDLDYIVYSEAAQNPFGTNENRNKKIYESAAALPPINIPNYFFKNKGDLSFENVTHSWSEDIPSMSNGAVYCDLDLDGDLDIVSSNVNEKAFIYKNTTRELNPLQSNYLNVRLKGSEKNTMGIGASVTLYYNDTLQVISQYPVRGYLSSIDNVMHFGLSKRNSVDSLKVIWPDGKIQVLKTIQCNKTITIEYKDALNDFATSNKKTDAILEDRSDMLKQVIHKENLYIDFLDQPLLLKMISREGPGISVGDINNDGLEDFFMTSAYRDTSYFWMQQNSGAFKRGEGIFNSWNFENLGSLIFDANNDGRLDLYIASGGNELPYSEKYYQDRLYIQEDNGKFSTSDRLPKISSSTSTVNAADFDADGDLDLFVGSRIKPKNYPLTDRSYVLENVNGYFKDITHSRAPEIENIGLVTSALWTDFNSDGQVDLIVVGEWMEVSFFENHKGNFKNITPSTGIGNLKGFWNSINGADFDMDGDIDYIIGNLGLNTELKASSDEPVSIVAKDFDGSGSIDPVIGYYVQGVKYPLPSRDALVAQISAMKKRFRFYKDYGKATYKDVFKEEELKGATTADVNFLKSIYVENKGGGKFSVKALANYAQIAPVYGIAIADLNQDMYPDIILTGNRRDTETLSGFLDGSVGTILLGNGKGDFKIIEDAGKTGLCADGEARGIAQMSTSAGTLFLVANNNAPLQCFFLNSNSKIIKLKSDDTYALINLSDGKSYRQEFYFGAGYLTQSSRTLIIPQNATSVIIYNSKNQKREVR